MLHDRILILDFGSQVTQLIARRVREAHVYCEVHPNDVSADFIREFNPKGIILSGSHMSAYEESNDQVSPAVFSAGVPVLGICYGMQTMAQQLGGRVESGSKREFGYAEVRAHNHTKLLEGIEDFKGPEGEGMLKVWMSHGDKVTVMPEGFKLMCSTPSCPIAGMADETRGFYAVQFHPEVTHTVQGSVMLKRFVTDICHCKPDWVMGDYIAEAVEMIRKQTNGEEVILGLSGGVDSSVAAALIHRAIGDKLTCVFVDNGLLRKGEREQVRETFEKNMGLKLIVVDAVDRFMGELAGVTDPEQKRKIIGREFVNVFQEEAEKLQKKIEKNTFDLNDYLLQLEKVSKMGSADKLLEMIPGAKGQINEDDINMSELSSEKAIIQSMTRFERSNYRIIGPSRRKRIAKGSGTSVADVNRLLKKFEKTSKLMHKVATNKKYQASMMKMFGNM